MAKVIYINGSSSAGKTTLATWIQIHSELPLFYYSIDTLLETMPPAELVRLRESSKTKQINWDALFVAYFRSAAALSEAGLDVILDCPIYERRIEFYNAHIAPLGPVSALLTCAQEELRRREKARGDRWVGLADYQAPRVMNSISHRFTFDSALTPVEDMGAKILACL